jgi:hypothetical protein
MIRKPVIIDTTTTATTIKSTITTATSGSTSPRWLVSTMA